jgi:putative ABC transport system permease protein
LGVMTRAVRNISRRKIRTLLVVIALGFSMAILIAIPPGISANQAATQILTGNLANTLTQTEASINQSLTEIDCSLTQSAPQGFSFSNPGAFSGGTGGFFGGNNGGGPIMRYGGGQFGGGDSTPMNETYYADLANISGVAAVEPVLQVREGHNQTVTPHFISRNGEHPPAEAMQSFNITATDYIITGIPLNSSLIDNYPILPTNITAGRNLQAGETGVALLSENCSAYFGKSVGDTVNILGKDFQVVGIFAPTGVEDNQVLYMNLDDAQALTNETDMVTSFHVFADSSDNVSAVAEAINSMYPELNPTTAQERLSQLQQYQSLYDEQLQNAQTTMNQTNMQAFEIIGIAVAATCIIILLVMLYTVRERTKEIGTLKALGFSNRNVMSQFLLEGILLSVFAGLVGVAIGTIAAPFLSSILLPQVGGIFGGGARFQISASGLGNSASAVTVSPELMLIAFGASILLGAVGSLYPAWRAARTKPAEAMRYE